MIKELYQYIRASAVTKHDNDDDDDDQDDDDDDQDNDPMTGPPLG